MIAHKNEKGNIKKVRYFMTEQLISEKVEKELIQIYQPKFNKNKKRKIKNINNIWKPAPTPEPIKIQDIKNFFSENSVDIQFFSEKSRMSIKLLKGFLYENKEIKPKTAEKMRFMMEIYLKYWKKEFEDIEEITNGEVKAEDLLKGE